MLCLPIYGLLLRICRNEFGLKQHHHVIASAAQQSTAELTALRWIAALRLQ